MKTFFWVCLGLLIPGMLLRIPVGGAGILATDIIVPFFCLLWLAKQIIVERHFSRPSFLLPGFIFLGIASISFFGGAGSLFPVEQIISGSYLVRIAYFLLFGWAAHDLFRRTEEQEKFWKRFFWIASIVLLLGFIQFYFVPDISRWSTEGGLDPHTGRLLGTWLDPNFMAGFISFLFPLGLGYWYQLRKKKQKIGFSFFLIACALALFFTFSRSGYLAGAFGVGLFLVLRDPKVLLILLLCVGIGIASNQRAQKRLTEFTGTISALLLHDTDEIDPTANLRLKSWQESLSLWEKYPILGIGYNTYRYRASEEGIVDENYFSSGGSDSTHITILVTSGIIGFLAFLWFYGTLFWKNAQRFFWEKNELFWGFSAGVAALFLHGIFVNSIFFPLLFLPVIAIAGVLEPSQS